MRTAKWLNAESLLEVALMTAGYNLIAIDSNLEVPYECPRRAPKHPLKTPRCIFCSLYLFVGWALLVVITHAIAFGAELLVASSNQPVVKWKATDECTDGTRTVYYNSPSLYQEFKVKIKDFKIVDAEPGSLSTIGATINAERVEHTDSHATYRIDLSILGRPSRTCLLECDIRGTTLHMSEIQMRPDKEISS